MQRTVLYFAWLREHIGLSSETLLLEPDVITLADLAQHLAARGGGYAQAFANTAKVRAALDQVMVPLDTPIGNAREIAFFPPVTGG